MDNDKVVIGKFKVVDGWDGISQTIKDIEAQNEEYRQELEKQGQMRFQWDS